MASAETISTAAPKAPNPTGDPKPEQAVRTEHLNKLFKDYERRHPDEVAVISLEDIVCPGGAPCPVTRDGIVLHPKDGGHYEQEGAGWVAPQLVDQLFTALRGLDARNRATTTTTTAR